MRKSAFFSSLLFLLPAFAFCGGVAWAFDVALVAAVGETTEEKRNELDSIIYSALEEQGHFVFTTAETGEAMGKMAIDVIDSLKDAEMLGSKMKVEFVVLARLASLAGQDSIEIKAYYLPGGRVELLEEMAAEGETEIIVTGMLKRLVTMKGLTEEETVEDKPAPGDKEIEDIDKAIGEVTGDQDKSGKEEEEDQEKLVKDLQEWPEKKKGIAYGIDYRISLDLAAGPTAMLTKPVAGGRAGGYASLSLGYVAVPSCGCDFGGEIRAFFGPVDAFSIAAFAGFNFRLSPTAPVYGGGKLSLGYLKNISGARSNRMILRGAANFTFVIRARYMIILNPISIVLLAFDGSTVVLYDGGLGFGVRF